MRRYVAACAVAAALGITGGTAVGLNQSHSGSSSTAAAAPTTTVPGHRGAAGRHRPGFGGPDQLHQVLANLVAKGTITQAQADAIEKAMAQARKDDLAKLRNRFSGAFRSFQGTEQTVADTLGISTDQLRKELESGKSLAQIAQEHGVPESKIVSAIVNKIDQMIDQQVSQGHLKADRAATIKAQLKGFVTKMVEGKGFGFDLRGFRQRRGAPGTSKSSPPVTKPPSTGPHPSTLPPAPAPPSTSATTPPPHPSPSTTLPGAPSTTAPSSSSAGH